VFIFQGERGDIEEWEEKREDKKEEVRYFGDQYCDKIRKLRN